MKKLHFISIVLVSFITGVIASDTLQGFSQIFRSDVNKNCVAETICVGDDASSILGYNRLDYIGGLRSIFCGKEYDTGNIEYIFLQDILSGMNCKKDHYSLIFGTNRTTTTITVQNKIIVKIRQGPLHTFAP